MKTLQLTLAAAFVAALPAAGADKPLDDKQFNEQFRPYFAKHCVSCHGEIKPKGSLRLDDIVPDFDGLASRDRWLKIVKRIKAGEMPPESKPRPERQETDALAKWVNGKVEAAIAKRAAEGRVVMRRLNRNEYENTIHDLLGVEADLKDQLPQDGSAEGFDNVGSALHVSSFLMEKYLEAADKALTLAIANRPKPTTTKTRYLLKDQHQVKSTTESVYRQNEETTILFSSSAWNAVGISRFYPNRESERGYYRFRISASAVQSDGKPVTFRVTSSSRGNRMSGKSGLVGYFDAPPGEPKVFEFVEYVELRNTISLLPYGLAGRTVKKAGADKWEGPGLAVQWVDIEGPLNESWPPAGHRAIFGDLAQGPAGIRDFRDRLEVISNNPEADAETILRRFVRRAFRRSVTDDDVKPYVTLVKNKLAEKYSFEQAIRVGLLAVMVSPEFLFLQEKPGKLDDFSRLASRLSYFLWSTMPDEELLTLAEQKKLSQPETLRQQVERLLKDPKASAFTENFVGQWLNLREIDFTEPGHILYPEFDHMLKVSMIRETELFFEEVLKNDLPLTNFVASDFSMLNGRLAKHYGIPGVDGWEFRKVKLSENSHRGGVLTMASVLKVTANGTYTSPVVRGVFVLERILGTPPPPPPDGVSAIVPDVRGATTIREQLAKHRAVASCANCHNQIDPAGFALESFDVIGGWREFYRSSGNGKPVTIDGKRMPYLHGKPVDPSDVLPDGRKFQNIDEFKQLLLKDKDQLARALTVKLLTYGTGGPPEPGNNADIEAIVANVRGKDYGFRALVHEIVGSKAFQNK